MAPNDPTLLGDILKEISNFKHEIKGLKIRVNDLERINDDRITEEKRRQLVSDRIQL
jgi:hypothetical protein